MSGTNSDDASKQGSTPEAANGNEAHTPGGAPKDEAHHDAGDGTLAGSVPAGLSRQELREQAESDKTDDGGTG